LNPTVSSTGRPLGAEVSGIDLREPLSDEHLRLIEKWLAQYQILVFRGQKITPEQQVQFTKKLGPLDPGISLRPEGHLLPGYTDVLHVSNEPKSGTLVYGMRWHSDGLSYSRRPHGTTVLHCIKMPPGVGDTLYASQYVAYELMSQKLQELLRGLYWHVPEIIDCEMPSDRGYCQPLVKVHPITQRSFIYCAVHTASRIVGMTPQESAGLLQVIYDYQVHESSIYRHQWQPDDVVIWENLATMHVRADVVDYHKHGFRSIHRTATAGNVLAIECPADEFRPTRKGPARETDELRWSDKPLVQTP